MSTDTRATATRSTNAARRARRLAMLAPGRARDDHPRRVREQRDVHCGGEPRQPGTDGVGRSRSRPERRAAEPGSVRSGRRDHREDPPGAGNHRADGAHLQHQDHVHRHRRRLCCRGQGRVVRDLHGADVDHLPAAVDEHTPRGRSPPAGCRPPLPSRVRAFAPVVSAASAVASGARARAARPRSPRRPGPLTPRVPGKATAVASVGSAAPAAR